MKNNLYTAISEALKSGQNAEDITKYVGQILNEQQYTKKDFINDMWKKINESLKTKEMNIEGIAAAAILEEYTKNKEIDLQELKEYYEWLQDYTKYLKGLFKTYKKLIKDKDLFTDVFNLFKF